MLLRQLNFSCILGNARSQYYKGKTLHYIDKVIYILVIRTQIKFNVLYLGGNSILSDLNAESNSKLSA